MKASLLTLDPECDPKLTDEEPRELSNKLFVYCGI